MSSRSYANAIAIIAIIANCKLISQQLKSITVYLGNEAQQITLNTFLKQLPEYGLIRFYVCFFTIVDVTRMPFWKDVNALKYGE